MLLTLDAKRRLTVPAALAAGDWLEVLKECPVAMDDLPPRRRQLPRRRKL